MIRALLYNSGTNEIRELNAEAVIESMPVVDRRGSPPPAAREKRPDTAPPIDSTGSFAKLKPHCHRGELMWIDVCDPTDDDYALLARRFSLHPMVIEDIKSREGRPKLHDYGDYLYIIFHALAQGEADAGGGATTPMEAAQASAEQAGAAAAAGRDRYALNIIEIDCLVGPDYVVTLHCDRVKPFRDLYNRWTRNPMLMHSGAPRLLYELIDEVLDDYFPILDALDERIDRFEDRLFLEWQENLSGDIFSLKRCLLEVRRVAGPTRDVVNMLMRHDADSGGRHFAYYQDLYDHASRIVDSIDTFRELLSGALDAYLAMASNRMNEIMKTLTSASIILLIPTLIAAIYGMNFDYMPELRTRYGYFVVLGCMAAFMGGMFFYFKRRKWL